MSQKKWTISFVPDGSGSYRVTVERGSAFHDFRAALPPDISDLWQVATGAATTRQFRSDTAAALTPQARFYQAADLPTLKDIGERLLETVFDLAAKGDGPHEGPKIIGALEDRIADNDGIEIEVDLTRAPELSGIPWESLYLRSRDRFLAIGTTSNIVRKLNAQSELPPPIERPIRILVVAANPKADLDTGAELGNIERRIAELVAEGSTDFEIQSLPNAKRDDLRKKINAWKPHVIHYIGHSAFIDDSGYIFLESGQDKKSDKVSAEVLRNMLLNNRPWLVVLNSCQSGMTSADAPMAGVAQNLLQRLNIPFVVAMQQPVSDDAAINFSQDFYTALTDGESIASAVTIGRCAIANDADVRTQVELITPALYTSGTVDRIAFAEQLPPVAAAAVPMALAAVPPAAAGEATTAPSSFMKRYRAPVAAAGVFIAGVFGAINQIDGIKSTVEGWFGEEEATAPAATPTPAPTATTVVVVVPGQSVEDALQSVPTVVQPEAQSPQPRVVPRRLVRAAVGGQSIPVRAPGEDETADNSTPTLMRMARPADDGSVQYAYQGEVTPVTGTDGTIPVRRTVRRTITSAAEPFQRPGAAAPTIELGGGDGYGEAYATEVYQPDQDASDLYVQGDFVREPVICDGLARTVHFDLGSAVPVTPDMVRLDLLSRQIACPNSNLVVAGFTDSSGSERTNIDLSVARAQSVVAALGEPFARRLMPAYVNAYAEKYQVTATADGVVEPANRRAEVFLDYRCTDPEFVVKSLAPGELPGPISQTKVYDQSAATLEPIRVTLHRRDLSGTIDTETYTRLDEIGRLLAQDLGAPPAAIFPMIAGGACLAIGENERIDIEY
ncbi:MAG: CHAT domain-containing protein [Tsuneonella sp.]